MVARKRLPAKKPQPRRAASARSKGRPRFVGRDASPVLDRYPPKAPGTAPAGPPPISLASPATPQRTPATVGPAGPAAPSASVQPLITLERPFDLDEFSALLGGTSIRLTVPRDALPEVLRRVTEFMDFGIYVYAISVRPAPGDLLKGFVVELQRVDYSAEKQAWLPFEEKGVTDSPFGPSGDRA
jgi:hypothetical protein